MSEERDIEVCDEKEELKRNSKSNQSDVEWTLRMCEVQHDHNGEWTDNIIRLQMWSILILIK